MYKKIISALLFMFSCYSICTLSKPSASAETWAGTNPKVSNLTLTSANTEYSYTFPIKTTSWSLKARTAVDLKYSWTSGESGTVFKTVPAGSEVYEENILMNNNIIYIQCATAGTIVEIEYWTRE